jgi:hypothetical protein
VLGYNNNVRHRDRVFHIQTEDSGVKHPHIITHLFVDGGRIINSVKTSYVEHLSAPDLSFRVRSMMKEQHKRMFLALREGTFDEQVDATGTLSGAPGARLTAPPRIPTLAPPALVQFSGVPSHTGSHLASGGALANLGTSVQSAGNLASLLPSSAEPSFAPAASTTTPGPGMPEGAPAGLTFARQIPPAPEEDRATTLDLSASLATMLAPALEPERPRSTTRNPSTQRQAPTLRLARMFDMPAATLMPREELEFAPELLEYLLAPLHDES